MSDTPLKAIRKKCVDCSGGSRKEVEHCHIEECSLFPYRFGMNPRTAAEKGKKVSNF